LQFLLEAALLAVVGGAIGVLLGAALAFIIGKAFEISVAVTPFYVVLSILVSSTVGIISGWYPAARACKLDPVEALRAD
jgi:putative ABC transport system permease protein